MLERPRWCNRCSRPVASELDLGQLKADLEAVTVASRRRQLWSAIGPPEPEPEPIWSRVRSGPQSFGLFGRVLLSALAIVPLALSVSHMVAIADSPAVALEFVVFFPIAFIAGAWLAEVWTKTRIR